LAFGPSGRAVDITSCRVIVSTSQSFFTVPNQSSEFEMEKGLAAAKDNTASLNAAMSFAY
jgi:hypothetical protein